MLPENSLRRFCWYRLKEAFQFFLFDGGNSEYYPGRGTSVRYLLDIGLIDRKFPLGVKNKANDLNKAFAVRIL